MIFRPRDEAHHPTDLERFPDFSDRGGPENPISSLSSPIWGHKICFMTIARIIIPKTKIQTRIRIGVKTQPMISMALDLKALPMAKVAVMSAVLGKTNEYQFIAKVSLSFPTQDQCAPTEMKKNQKARLSILASNFSNPDISLPPDP